MVDLATLARTYDAVFESCQPRIVTEPAYYGWYATTDSYTGPPDPFGWALTEEAAVAELKDRLEETL